MTPSIKTTISAKYIVAALGALMLSACAPSVDTTDISGQVESSFDAEQDFGAYKAFSWVNERPLVISGDYPISEETEKTLMTAIQDRLTQAGYTYVDTPENADFAVSFTAGASYDIKFEKPSTTAETGYERTNGEDDMVAPRARTEGSLIIDIFDVERKTKVWSGGASNELSILELSSDDGIAGAVTAILSEFPPQ